jgi:hypothetical protein
MHESTMFSCKAHWFRLPKQLRDEIWRDYRGERKLYREHLKAAMQVWSQQ